MGKQTFSTHGFQFEFEDNSGEILAAFQKAASVALEVIGATAVGYAQDELRTPKMVYPGVVQDAVDTSELLQTIGYKVVDDEVYIGTNTEQGLYVELGTGQYSTVGGGTPKPSWVYQDEFGEWHRAYPQMARPFLKPAASEHTTEYRDILEDTLENA